MNFAISLLVVSLASSAQQRAVPVASAIQAAATAGDWHRTQVLAQAALAKDRRNYIAWTYSGFANDHLGHPADALHDFAEAVRLSPKSIFVHNNYGASLESNGKKMQALTEYRISIALDADQPAALVNLARLLANSGRSEDGIEARGLLQTAWKLSPDAEIARSLLLLEPCARQAAPTGSAPDAAINDYAVAATADVGLAPDAQKDAIGAALVHCGQPQQALLYFDAMKQHEPLSEPSILTIASAQLELNKPQEAGRTLETAFRDGQKSPAILAKLSEVYARTGHPDQAVTAMRMALQIDPNDEEMIYRYGLLLLDIPAPKAAEMRVREALDRNGQSASLWFLLGLSQFDQVEPGIAQVSFERSISLRPNFAPALAYRGLCALDQTDYAAAEKWYRQAIAADPTAGDLHLLLAEALEKKDSTQTGAIKDELEAAISLDGSLAPAYLALGRLALRQRNPEGAVTWLQKALQLDSRQRQAHYYLARAYYQLHQNARAADESKLYKEEEASAQAADRAAVQDATRKLATTRF